MIVSFQEHKTYVSSITCMEQNTWFQTDTMHSLTKMLHFFSLENIQNLSDRNVDQRGHMDGFRYCLTAVTSRKLVHKGRRYVSRERMRPSIKGNVEKIGSLIELRCNVAHVECIALKHILSCL